MISTYFVSSTLQALGKRFPDLGEQALALLDYDPSGSYVLLPSFFDVLEGVARHTNDPDIGLKLGSNLAPACFNVQGQLVMSCATLGDALPVVLRFHTLILPGSKIGVDKAGERVRFTWNMPESKIMPRVFVDLIVSATCQFGAWITGGETSIPFMGFTYRKPVKTDLHRELYHGRQSFSQSTNFISVPVRWRDLEIKTASINLKPVLAEHADALLADLNCSAGYLMRLENMVLLMLGDGESTIECLAQRVGVSERSLQRELQEHALSFSLLLRRVRERRANHLLSRSHIPITDIALDLGYQSSSAFSKAYKQWTGVSPQEVRRIKRDSKLPAD